MFVAYLVAGIVVVVGIFANNVLNDLTFGLLTIFGFMVVGCSVGSWVLYLHNRALKAEAAHEAKRFVDPGMFRGKADGVALLIGLIVTCGSFGLLRLDASLATTVCACYMSSSGFVINLFWRHRFEKKLGCVHKCIDCFFICLFIGNIVACVLVDRTLLAGFMFNIISACHLFTFKQVLAAQKIVNKPQAAKLLETRNRLRI